MVNKGKKYIHGHNSLGTKFSLKRRKQISKKKIGVLNPQWKGGRAKCEICKKELTDYRSTRCRNHMKPMSEKNKKILSSQRIGSNNPMFGKKLSDNHKKKLSIVNSNRRGKNNPNWRGTVPLNKSIRELPESRDLKIETFIRDNRKCVVCGSGDKIEAHHIVSVAEIINKNQLKTINDCLKCKLLFDIENLITLCNKCHKKTKNYGCSKKYFVDKRGIIRDILVKEDFNSLTEITFEIGAVRGNHKHPNSRQVDFILDGVLLFSKDGFESIVGPGSIITIEPNEEHAYKAIKHSRIISIFKGPRQGNDYASDTIKLLTPLI